MSKDPAILFYFNDWQGGTMTMTRHQKGCYMDLLCAQFNTGHLSLDAIKTVLGNDFAIWGVLQKKFKLDNDGLFYNERLLFEKNRRKNFSESRRKNASGEKHMPEHMENEIENRKFKFLNEIGLFKEKCSEKTLNKFCDYWTEHSANGKKMRFEMEKVFDISRRLNTWISNETKFNKSEPSKIIENKQYTIDK